jgi:hypothetical protein
VPTEAFLSKSTDTVVNLLHQKLFYHFQTWTCRTLFLPPEVWDQALQLSFQFEFLMNALMCVAARHLAVLQPDNPTYATAGTSHLCRTLTLFRRHLSKDLVSTHPDVFMSTSLLIQYALWASTDFVSRQDDGTLLLDLSRDRIFAVSSSLKEVFIKCMPFVPKRPSVFLPCLSHDPRVVLDGAANVSSDTVAEYQELFSYGKPITLDLLNVALPGGQSSGLADPASLEGRTPNFGDALDPTRSGYMSAIDRLCLVMSFLPETRPFEVINAKSA